MYAPLKIYHATEDYFCEDFVNSFYKIDDLKGILAHTDLLVPVSEGLGINYVEKGGYRGESMLLTNGCDYNFWVGESEHEGLSGEPNKKIALYQGGIHTKIDFALLHEVISKMPEGEFRFCGTEIKVTEESFQAWKSLCTRENVTYLGTLGMEELRKEMYNATVGMIPFVQNDWIIQRSFPLKAFEYVACGLPVVCVPIKSLLPYQDVFHFADSAGKFIDALIAVAPLRYEQECIRTRRELAKKQDYEEKFSLLSEKIESLIAPSLYSQGDRLNILMLYDSYSIHVPTLKEHLESFSLYSSHRVFYMHATGDAACAIDLSLFEVVVLHYSIRVSLPNHLSESFADKLQKYRGLKILFIQDEYDTTNTAKDWIEKLGIHIVYTCVPGEYVEQVYPSAEFPYVRFNATLTGYVPIKTKRFDRLKPLSSRKKMIGYRGRALPFFYGTLGQEKLQIGKRMRQLCDARNIITDIEWEDRARIYGEQWYSFLEDCRATLGTESGSNVFDFDGTISKNIVAAVTQRPDISFEEVFARYLKDHEGKIIMNQISPKIFEAISLRTALILFEGAYSAVVKPHKHFIPLKKDFSNVDEVLEKVQDLAYIEALTRRAYDDIIRSGAFSYRGFIQDFDALVSSYSGRSSGMELVSALTLLYNSDRKEFSWFPDPVAWSVPINTDIPEKLSPREKRMLDAIKMLLRLTWDRTPQGIRKVTKRLLKPLVKPLLIKREPEKSGGGT